MRLSVNFNGRIEIDEASSTVTYVGKAPYGVADSDPSWYIVKLTSSGNDLSIKSASTLFDQVWTNRASLTYS